MFEIKFDAANEKLFVDYLRLMIIDNPTILSNIVEPTVNELISDANVPQAIRDRINASFIELGSRNLFVAGMNDFFSELFENEYGDQFINDMVVRHLTENEEMKHLIDAKIDHAINEVNVEQQVEDSDIQGSINQQLEEAITEDVEHTINFSNRDFERIAISAIETKLDEQELEEHIVEVTDRKLSELLSERVISANLDIPHVISNKLDTLLTPNLIKEIVNKYLDDHKLIDQVKKEDKPDLLDDVPVDGLDTIEIKVLRNQTTKVMWLLGLLNKEIFSVKQVGAE